MIELQRMLANTQPTILRPNGSSSSIFAVNSRLPPISHSIGAVCNFGIAVAMLQTHNNRRTRPQFGTTRVRNCQILARFSTNLDPWNQAAECLSLATCLAMLLLAGCMAWYVNCALSLSVLLCRGWVTAAIEGACRCAVVAPVDGSMGDAARPSPVSFPPPSCREALCAIACGGGLAAALLLRLAVPSDTVAPFLFRSSHTSDS
jgi:hypothetical protein